MQRSRARLRRQGWYPYRLLEGKSMRYHNILVLKNDETEADFPFFFSPPPLLRSIPSPSSPLPVRKPTFLMLLVPSFSRSSFLVFVFLQASGTLSTKPPPSHNHKRWPCARERETSEYNRILPDFNFNIISHILIDDLATLKISLIFLALLSASPFWGEVLSPVFSHTVLCILKHHIGTNCL